MRPADEFPRDVTDRMIRESLSQPANLADLLSQVVPDLAPRLDFSHARLVSRDFLTEDWHRREADLPFEVPLLAGAPGESALVFVLIEHQSDTDPLLPLRMLFCTVGFWARQWQLWEAAARPREPLRLSPVIPVVLYTASVPWGSNTSLADLVAGPEAFHAFVRGWEPLFWNLSEQAPEALLGGGPWMQFLAVVRTAAEAPELFRTTLERAGRNLIPLATSEAVRWAELLRLMFDYATWRRPSSERPGILDAIRRTAPREQESDTMGKTIDEIWIEEGRKEGMEKGLEKGLEQGEIRTIRRMLLRCLEVRFGSVPGALSQQITEANELPRLEQAYERALRVQSLAEFTL